jgi:cell division septal protein FtsQ
MMTRRNTGNHRKRGASSSRHHLLELNVRTASLQRQRREKAGGLLWKLFASLAVLTLLAASVVIGVEKFFFRNSEYSLHHLDAHLDGILTQEELVTATGFEMGKNIFQLPMDQALQKLEAMPEVRTATLERILPDTIKVNLERRIPVFLLAETGDTGESFVSGKSLLCDKEGFLMQPARLVPEFLNLPVLRGIDPGDSKPGSRLENERLAYAVQLKDALEDIPEMSFKIRSIDVSKEYAAVVTDASNAQFTFGNKDLPGQMERLRQLLAHCQETGRVIATANLMLTRNTPVTFVMTPEAAQAKITPIPTTKKSAHR